MTVAARLGELVSRYDLPPSAAACFTALLEALAAEPDPPTTVRAPTEAVDGHIADSLVALDLGVIRTARRIADIGAGAGFPGLALAVALPGAQVDLIEATRRKCEVIERLAVSAGVERRARAIAARAEEWAVDEGAAAYEVVTARALASLPVVLEYAAPLLRPRGVLVAWKGAADAAEEAAGVAAAAEVGLEFSEKRSVRPFRAAERRHLYLYSKVTETPPRFPRRPGMAAKRPLGNPR